MSETRVVELKFDKPPKTGGAIVKTLFSGRPAQAPESRLGVKFHATWNGAKADETVVAKYRALVGLPDDGTVPPMYMHALVMPLRIAMFTNDAFPMRVMGLVHFTNSIKALRPVRTGEAFDVSCSLDGITPTEKGQSFDVVSTVSVGGEVVWQETATFLAPLPASARAKGAKDAPKPAVVDWGEPVAKWKVPGNAGRVFSRIANDPNPIHMSAITAKLFGFKQAIAHGMFSVGRCVAMIQKDHPVDGPFQVDVRFKRPLFIPGAVALHTIVDDEGTKFLLKVQPKGEPHVEGRIAKL